jgi:uracil-DNA glycosylase
MYDHVNAHNPYPVIQDHIEGCLSWWSLAGVDTCVADSPKDWRISEQKFPSLQTSTLSSPAAHTTMGPMNAFPNGLEEFHLWLAECSKLLESSWSGATILPRGPANPALMVILDMPDSTAPSPPGGYLRDDSALLLRSMLMCLGQDQDSVYFAALSTKRPPGGILSPEASAALATRMMHHISLVKPTSVLVLGDGTNRYLKTTDAAQTAGFLRNINHEGLTVPAIATYHPRLMLNQPSAKAECWRAMQQLIRIWVQ